MKINKDIKYCTFFTFLFSIIFWLILYLSTNEKPSSYEVKAIVFIVGILVFSVICFVRFIKKKKKKDIGF